MAFSIPGSVVEYILLGPADDPRPLQDSPILGDVWRAYASAPTEVQDLLITPYRDSTAAKMANGVLRRSERLQEITGERRGGRVSYLHGIAAAKLPFADVLQVLVPLTGWWDKRDVLKKLKSGDYRPRNIARRLDEIYAAKTYMDSRSPAGSQGPSPYDKFTALDRYITLAGLVLWAGTTNAGLNRSIDDPGEAVLAAARESAENITELLVGLFSDLMKAIDVDDAENKSVAPKQVFQISLNRRTWAAVETSVPAVKADAARSLFSVSCERVTWAVLDSGIDSGHPAFQTRDGSRVRETYDFTQIRDIVHHDADNLADDVKRTLAAQSGLSDQDVEAALETIATDARNSRPTDWNVVGPLLRLEQPAPPRDPHGTHVAGILGASGSGPGAGGEWGGMCPEINFYDFRVMAKHPDDSEFAVMGALEFIRHLNRQHNSITIHGANLSLSILHEVSNYACGRTPVCEECERVVDSGVVVVAAAGNRGYHKYETDKGPYAGYAAFSITDPGNAEAVITVGSTHGHAPHTYGVSFFSSRGPTGDGRVKPDLVAPGERVLSTVLDGEWGSDSGTSMAAPHVSGAAAMLMARYPELIGEPQRIKQILCDSATDLGRERTFQGRGMLDVLRALQSL